MLLEGSLKTILKKDRAFLMHYGEYGKMNLQSFLSTLLKREQLKS